MSFSCSSSKAAVGIKDLFVGEAETVGVLYFPGEQNSHPPLRIYYPAIQKQPAERISLFAPEGFGYFLTGYLHVIGIKHDTWLHRFVMSPILNVIGASLSFLSYCNVPMFHLHAPTGVLSQDAPPCKQTKKKYPLIVFSHGLSGTGHENTLLHAAWAKLGFIVVSVHHTDGSSARVRLYSSQTPNTYEDQYYQHGPSFQNYDPTFRPKQIQHRAKDLKQAVDFVINNSNNTHDDLQSVMDTDTIIVAGYSYGAATAALTTYTNPQWFNFDDDKNRRGGLILLDGWFYIDVLKSAGIEFEFPSQVFQQYRNEKADKKTKIPSVFINSKQFTEYPKLYKATCELGEMLSQNNSKADKNIGENYSDINNNINTMHVIEGTRHHNFVDLIWWFYPHSLLRRLKIIGSADAGKAYRDIIQISTTFLKENFASLRY